MCGLHATLLDLRLLNLMITVMQRMQFVHLMAGQYVGYGLVLRCHLACLAEEMIEVVVMIGVVVAAVVDDEAGEMTMMTGEEVEEVMADLVLEVLEEVDTQEVEVALLDEEGTEVLEGAEADLLITVEEIEAFHPEDHQALDEMIKVEAKVAVDPAPPNIMEEGGVWTPTEAIIESRIYYQQYL